MGKKTQDPRNKFGKKKPDSWAGSQSLPLGIKVLEEDGKIPSI